MLTVSANDNFDKEMQNHRTNRVMKKQQANLLDKVLCVRPHIYKAYVWNNISFLPDWTVHSYGNKLGTFHSRWNEQCIAF